jgi:hypothetical protein
LWDEKESKWVCLMDEDLMENNVVSKIEKGQGKERLMMAPLHLRGWVLLCLYIIEMRFIQDVVKLVSMC